MLRVFAAVSAALLLSGCSVRFSKTLTDQTCSYVWPGKNLYYGKQDLTGVWNGTPTLSRNLWIANGDGTGQTPLTKNTLANLDSTAPHFYSNATKVVFTSKMSLTGVWDAAGTSSINVWVMNSDGTGLTPLTQNTNAGLDVTGVVPSPDSTKLLFTTKMPLAGGWNGVPTGSANLWVMNIDGTNAHPLTQNTNAGLDVSSAQYSDDGTQITFTTAMPLAGGWNGVATLSSNIWVASADGSNMRPVTRNTATNLLSRNAHFAPDGYRLVMESRTALDGSWNGLAPNTSNLWVIGEDGLNAVAITKNTNGKASFNGQWSPDGRLVAFQGSQSLDGLPNGAPTVAAQNVWIANSDGTNLVAITRDTLAAFVDVGPRFSPDGTKVQFSASSDLNGAWDGTATPQNVWQANPDGTDRVAITENSSVGFDMVQYGDAMTWYLPKNCQ